MSTIVRLSLGLPKISVANPKENLEEILLLLRQLPQEGSDIIVLPRWALTSAECGSLTGNGALAHSAKEALAALAKETSDCGAYLLVGLPYEQWGQIVPTLAVLHRGRIVALLPCNDHDEGTFSEEHIFACGSLRFGVLTGSADTLTRQAVTATRYGLDLLVFPTYHPVTAGSIDRSLAEAQTLSRSLGCGVALVNGGVGGSSSPYFYRGYAALYEAGTEIGSVKGEQERTSITGDLDTEVLAATKQDHSAVPPAHQIPLVFPKPDLLRPVRKNPFLPEENQGAYLEELFHYQVQSLATRLRNTGIQKMVLGVSGGLDSTMALLVCLGVCDSLGLPRTHLIGLTQPGMGTSDRTYYNALAMMEAAGIAYHDISIRPGATQMLQDLGHSGQPDTTYENIQARERSQMLFNLANMTGALVVGTGDLSEEALGFSTFGGDHLSNFNVNACLTKTVMRELLHHLVHQDIFPEISPYIQEALDTPISPELLPPDSHGEIQQKTEDILGPYLLHDFFLYYFVRYNMRPSKIYRYACIAFADSLDSVFIKEKLILFFRKFCAGQFKRSCAPDAASITEVNLLGVTYRIPSDLDPSVLLEDLK